MRGPYWMKLPFGSRNLDKHPRADSEECRRAIREEFRSRAVGDESMKAAHWKDR